MYNLKSRKKLHVPENFPTPLNTDVLFALYHVCVQPQNYWSN